MVLGLCVLASYVGEVFVLVTGSALPRVAIVAWAIACAALALRFLRRDSRRMRVGTAGIVFALVSVLLFWPGNVRRAMLERVNQLEVGMPRADVERLFAGFEENHPLAFMFAAVPPPDKAAFTHPERGGFHYAERIELRFDAEDRVASFKLIVDP